MNMHQAQGVSLLLQMGLPVVFFPEWPFLSKVGFHFSSGRRLQTKNRRFRQILLVGGQVSCMIINNRRSEGCDSDESDDWWSNNNK